MHGDPILLFMIQVAVVLVLARVLGEVFRRFHQPPLAGEILAGLLLGQTVLGHLAPDLFASLFPPDEIQEAMFRVTAELGIMFMLLVVGLEVNVASAWKMRNQTFTVAVAGVVLPLAFGALVAWLMYDQWVETSAGRLPFALLVGAGIAITAITVVARLLFDLKILKSDLGLFLVSAMALNELLGWAVLAVVLGLVGIDASGQGSGAVDLAGTLIGVVAFAAFALTVGRGFTTRALLWMEAKRLPSPAAPLSLVVILGLLGGITTSWLGVHPVFGFLLGGMMAGDPRALSEHTRSIIEEMVLAIFVPLFFAGICLRIDFVNDFNWPMVAIITALSIGGKFLGAGAGTLMVNMPAADKLPVAIAHIPGGPMGVLLASVAFQADVIGSQMFVALVVASILSALAVGPLFAWSLARMEVHDVSRYFAEEHLLWNLCVDSRADAIDRLCAHAATVDGLPSSGVIRRMVAEREAAMGTGIGHGIAIPHARLDGLARSLVVTGICKDGVDWDEIDDRPAQLIFLILTPADDPDDSQLEILAKIARSFSRADAVQAVVEAGDADVTWSNLHAALASAD